jgi:hypothetical protein
VPDFDDSQLTHAFADFRTGVAPYVAPAGIDAAHTTVRRRRRARAVAAGLLVVAALAVPAVVFASVSNDPHGPPPQWAHSGAPSAPATQPPPVPTAAPSAAPAPDGRISAAELGRSTLDIPAWAPQGRGGCPSGKVAFSAGRHYVADSVHEWIGTVAYADLDGDGAQETAVIITCGDQQSTFQVVAFDRAASGAIRTLGQVTAVGNGVQAACDLRADGDAIAVRVGDVYAEAGRGCANPPPYMRFQWRGYRFDGIGFTQVSGPTAFPVNRSVADYATTATDLTFSPPSGGVRHGSMRVTVRNLGPGSTPYQLVVQVPAGITPVAPSGFTVASYVQVDEATWAQSSLAPGGSRTLTLQFTATDPVTPDFLPQVSARLADRYKDPDVNNSAAQFKITYN